MGRFLGVTLQLSPEEEVLLATRPIRPYNEALPPKKGEYEEKTRLRRKLECEGAV